MIQQSNTLWNDHHCKSSNLQNYISITDYIPYAIYPCDVSILYLKVCISSSPSPSLPTPHPNHLFALCICKSVSVCLSDYTYKWDHMVLVFLWFTSFSIILSRSIHVVENGTISFFFYGRAIVKCVCVCVCVCVFFSIHLSMDIQVDSTPWLLWIVLQWTYGYIYLFELVFVFFSNYSGK